MNDLNIPAFKCSSLRKSAYSCSRVFALLMVILFFSSLISDAAKVKFLLLGDTQHIMNTSYGDSYKNLHTALERIGTDPVTQDAVALLHMGDMIETGRDNDIPLSYDRMLDGLKKCDIPWIPAFGNNDNTSEFNKTFPISLLDDSPHFIENKSDSRNLAHEFSAGGAEWLVITLKLTSGSSEHSWAEGLIQQNPEKNVIIVRHDISSSTGGDPTKHFIKYDNVKLLTCGHAGADLKLLSGSNGHKVGWIRHNWHSHRKDTYMAVVTFDTVAGTLHVRHYSPLFRKFFDESDAPHHDEAPSFAPWTWSGFEFEGAPIDDNPAVSFATPANGALIAEGTNLEVTVNATDSNGISRVYLYKNGVELARSEGGAPYTWGEAAQNDVELQNLQIGTHTLRARAVDTQGREGEATITITVADSNTHVSFANPANGHTIWEGESVAVEVDAVDLDGVNRVYLYKNGVELPRSEGIAPYNWGEPGQGDVDLENLAPGTHQLRAVAVDSLGNQGEATISIVVRDLSEMPPILVNFQPSGAAVPSGYLVDSSQAFGDRGNNFSYGWNATTNGTRDRGIDADQRKDTITHAQLNGTSYTWEIEVPNGEYEVSVTGGDPGYNDSFVEFLAEQGTANEVTLVSGSTASVNFVSGTQLVTVSDGRLTVSNGPLAVNNKICYIDIIPGGSPNEPPVIIPPQPITPIVGEQFCISFTAADADGDDITYVSVERPGWMTFDPATGELCGTPTSPGSYIIRVQARDPHGDFSEESITITVDPAPDPYEDWKSSNNVTTDDGDDDNDGLSNLVEFALGGNPKQRDSGGIHPDIVDNGSDFDFKFRRNESTVTYIIESSSDLSTWVEHERIVDDRYGAIGADCTVPVPLSGMTNGKLFLRLKVER